MSPIAASKPPSNEEVESLARRLQERDIQRAKVEWEEQNRWIEAHPNWRPRTGQAAYVNLDQLPTYPLNAHYLDQARQIIVDRAHPKQWKVTAWSNPSIGVDCHPELIVVAPNLHEAVQQYRLQTGLSSDKVMCIAQTVETPSREDFMAMRRQLKLLRSAMGNPKATMEWTEDSVHDCPPTPPSQSLWIVRSRYRKPSDRMFPAGLTLPNRPMFIEAKSNYEAMRHFRQTAPFPYLEHNRLTVEPTTLHRKAAIEAAECARS
jgi:hypothetical protein